MSIEFEGIDFLPNKHVSQLNLELQYERNQKSIELRLTSQDLTNMGYEQQNSCDFVTKSENTPNELYTTFTLPSGCVIHAESFVSLIAQANGYNFKSFEEMEKVMKALGAKKLNNQWVIEGTNSEISYPTPNNTLTYNADSFTLTVDVNTLESSLNTTLVEASALGLAAPGTPAPSLTPPTSLEPTQQDEPTNNIPTFLLVGGSLVLLIGGSYLVIKGMNPEDTSHLAEKSVGQAAAGGYQSEDDLPLPPFNAPPSPSKAPEGGMAEPGNIGSGADKIPWN